MFIPITVIVIRKTLGLRLVAVLRTQENAYRNDLI